MTETKTLKNFTLKNFIRGEHVDAAGGRTYDLVNPATGQTFAQAPVSEQADVDRAFEVAGEGFETWRDATPSERQLALLRLADAIEERAEELVRAESENTGKPFGLTMEEEIPAGVDQIRFFAGAARCLDGKSAGEYLEGYTSFVRREPVGVIGQVTPWNYPMMMAIWKFAPAIAAGNTIVIKPSDTTPVSTVMMAEIAAEFLPEGVFNVVCGDRGHGTYTGPAPHTADGRDHRFRKGRDAGRGGGGLRPQTGPPGARRQGAGDHLRRCRPRGGGRGDRGCRLLQRWPGLHRGHPRARPPRHPRRLRGGDHRTGQEHEDGRPR